MSNNPTGTLIETLRHRADTERLPAPTVPGFIPQLPKVDSEIVVHYDTDDTPLGRSLAIRYVDSAGEESGRRISVHHVTTRRDIIYVQAFCHERRAARSFRADRIIEIIDTETGEVVCESAVAHRLRSLLNPGDPTNATTTALAQCRPGVLALLFLARCDGQEHPSETDVILGFLDQATSKGIDEAMARKRLAGLYPDPRAYDRALKNLGRDAQSLKNVARAAVRLLDADGAISPEEATFALALQELVDRGGL